MILLIALVAILAALLWPRPKEPEEPLSTNEETVVSGCCGIMVGIPIIILLMILAGIVVEGL